MGANSHLRGGTCTVDFGQLLEWSVNTNKTENLGGLWRFANAEFNERRHELKVDGKVVPLDETPLGVLLCLLRAEGELVTKDELFDTVWAERDVTDGALSQAVKRLRTVLGDSDRTTLRTVHGHGFRLDASIEYEGESEDRGTLLQLTAGDNVPGLAGWTLDERLQTRPSNELWRIHSESGENGVLKLALNTRAERALRREVTLNRVLFKELGDNPPLVPLVEWQFDSAPFWVRMPWYPGGNLAHWIEAQGGVRTIALQRRINIIIEASGLLASAHELGVMHKDIKPGNLLVDESSSEPRLMLTDFGNGVVRSRDRLAQAGVTVMGFTQTIGQTNQGGPRSNISGTPTYMAPEIVAGGIFTEQADVYALGVMLYQLVSGEMYRPLAPGWEDDISDSGLRGIIAAACAGRPERRIASMNELAQKLRSWTPQSTLDIAPAPTPNPTSNTPPRKTPAVGQWIAIATAGVALVLAAAAWLNSSKLVDASTLNNAPPTETGIANQQYTSTERSTRVALLPFDISNLDASFQSVLSGLQNALINDLSLMTNWQLVIGASLAEFGMENADAAEIGHLLQVTRLVRGSVAHTEGVLQVHLQIVDTSNGKEAWSQSITGQAGELFELQERIGETLSTALGNGALPKSGDRPSNPGGYSDYLAALAFFQSEGAYTTESAKEFLRLIDAAVASNPHLIAAHLLAVRGTSDAFDGSTLDRDAAEARLDRSLTTLEALDSPAPMLAMARSWKTLFVDWDAQTALQIFQPHWPELKHLPYAIVFYASLLESTGNIGQLLELLDSAVNIQPTDISSLEFLANFNLNERKDPVSAMDIWNQARKRFPDDSYLAYLFALFGTYATGDEAWMERLLATTEQRRKTSMGYLRPRLNKAYRDGDQATLLMLTESIPTEGFSERGYHTISPKSLTMARVLDAAQASEDRIKHYASLALKSLNARRATSDSPGRKVTAAIALAMLGRHDEAFLLTNEALAEMPPTRNEQAYDGVLQRALRVFALVGDDEKLLAGLAELYGPGGYTQGDCWAEYGSVLAAPLHRRPVAAAWLQEHCASWLRGNRPLLAKYLEN
ncbi:MAG: protein kinase domain-containing protein [Oceanococcus sp.]